MSPRTWLERIQAIYFRIDEEILWKTSQEDIPPLIARLEEILRQNPTVE